MTHYLTDLTLELAAITKVGADIAITMWERQVGVTTPLVHAGLSLQKLDHHLSLVENLHNAIQANDARETKRSANRILTEIQKTRVTLMQDVEDRPAVTAPTTGHEHKFPLEKAEKAVTNILSKLSQGKGPNNDPRNTDGRR
jgi:hypothetical protein